MLFTFIHIYVIKDEDTYTLYDLFRVPPIHVEQSVVQAGITEKRGACFKQVVYS